MPRNLGETDRIIRVFVGLFLFFVGIFIHSLAYISWHLLGPISVTGGLIALSGLIGWDPIYSYLGEDTQVKEER